MVFGLNELLRKRNVPLPMSAIDRFPVLRSMLAWWQSAKPGHPPSVVDPLDLPREALGYIAILELEPPADAIFRLAGTHICELYGHELKGMSIHSFFDGRDANGVSEDLYSTARTLSPTLKSRFYVSINGKICRYTRLLLPLSEEAGTNLRVLKALEPHSLAKIPEPTGQ